MKMIVKFEVETEIELDPANFEDCSDEDELFDAIVDEIGQTELSFEIGDDTFCFEPKNIRVEKKED